MRRCCRAFATRLLDGDHRCWQARLLDDSVGCSQWERTSSPKTRVSCWRRHWPHCHHVPVEVIRRKNTGTFVTGWRRCHWTQSRRFHACLLYGKILKERRLALHRHANGLNRVLVRLISDIHGIFHAEFLKAKLEACHLLLLSKAPRRGRLLLGDRMSLRRRTVHALVELRLLFVQLRNIQLVVGQR